MERFREKFLKPTLLSINININIPSNVLLALGHLSAWYQYHIAALARVQVCKAWNSKWCYLLNEKFAPCWNIWHFDTGQLGETVSKVDAQIGMNSVSVDIWSYSYVPSMIALSLQFICLAVFSAVDLRHLVLPFETFQLHIDGLWKRTRPIIRQHEWDTLCTPIKTFRNTLFPGLLFRFFTSHHLWPPMFYKTWDGNKKKLIIQ